MVGSIINIIKYQSITTAEKSDEESTPLRLQFLSSILILALILVLFLLFSTDTEAAGMREHTSSLATPLRNPVTTRGGTS